MSSQEPAWSRSSLALALSGAPRLEDFAPERAFGASTGRGVRVAVVDSGIEADHPLLGSAVDRDGAVSFEVDGTGRLQRVDGPHDDVYGHGTACAGIIHALAPEAVITSVRVLDGNLRGRAAAFHAGLVWAVEQGFDVINLSLGAGQRDWALAFHEACDRGYFANSFIVTAAANVARDSFPSLFASVASVACNHSRDPWRFHFNPEPPTEFLARGIEVEVAWRGGGTVVSTGNSFAAPHVAAFAALIKASHPELRPFQVKTALWAAAANVREATAGRKPPARAPDPPTARPSASAPDPAARPAPAAPTRSHPDPDLAPDPEGEELGRLLPGYAPGPPLPPDPWGSRHLAVGPSGDRVVVRRINRRLAPDRRTRARFDATMAVVAGLHHPHLLAVLDLRADGEATVVVQPWCPDDLARRPPAEPLPAPAAVAAVLGLLAGLEVAHAAGVYHGDLRPGNALIDSEGRVVVSDIGLAAALSSDIRTSAAPGDPLSWTYLAPEQLEGGAVGPYTDVHAAGLILFELLSGALPHPPVATLGALAGQRARDRPRNLGLLAPDCGPALADLVDAAVATEPARRPPTVVAMATALDSAAAATFGSDWRRHQPFNLASSLVRSLA